MILLGTQMHPYANESSLIFILECLLSVAFTGFGAYLVIRLHWVEVVFVSLDHFTRAHMDVDKHFSHQKSRMLAQRAALSMDCVTPAGRVYERAAR